MLFFTNLTLAMTTFLFFFILPLIDFLCLFVQKETLEIIKINYFFTMLVFTFIFLP